MVSPLCAAFIRFGGWCWYMSRWMMELCSAALEVGVWKCGPFKVDGSWLLFLGSCAAMVELNRDWIWFTGGWEECASISEFEGELRGLCSDLIFTLFSVMSSTEISKSVSAPFSLPSIDISTRCSYDSDPFSLPASMFFFIFRLFRNQFATWASVISSARSSPRIELQPSTILDRSNEPGYGFREYTLSRYCRHLIGHMILCRGFLLVIAGGEILPALAGLPEIAFEMTPFGDGKWLIKRDWSEAGKLIRLLADDVFAGIVVADG